MAGFEVTTEGSGGQIGGGHDAEASRVLDRLSVRISLTSRIEQEIRPAIGYAPSRSLCAGFASSCGIDPLS
jgi:hypothetical protein